MNQDFPQLEQFFGYFHQDWVLDYGTEEMAIAQFLEESTEDARSKLLEEIRRLLALDWELPVLRQYLLRDLGCCYAFPNTAGMGPREWLLDLLCNLEKASKTPRIVPPHVD